MARFFSSRVYREAGRAARERGARGRRWPAGALAPGAAGARRALTCGPP